MSCSPDNSRALLDAKTKLVPMHTLLSCYPSLLPFAVLCVTISEEANGLW